MRGVENGSHEEQRKGPKPAALPIGVLMTYPQGVMSADGRLLKENSSHTDEIARVKAAGVPMDMVRCPYSGIREGKQMHASALRAMNTHWDDIINGLGWVRNLYFQGRNPSQVTLTQAIELTGLAQHATLFGLRRGENPFPMNAVPNDVAGMYRLARGVIGSLTQMPLPPGTVMTPEFITTFAENRRQLIRGDEACAASPRKMSEALSALLYGTDTSPEESNLAEYFPNPSQLRKFTDLVTRQLIHATELRERSTMLRGEMRAADDATKIKLYDKYQHEISGYHRRAIQAHRQANIALGRVNPTTPPEFHEAKMMIPGYIVLQNVGGTLIF